MSPASPSAVQMRGITRYFGAFAANRGIDLDVEAGTVHAVVGENGAGKSTLLRILAGVDRADAGEVFIAGRRLLRADPGLASRLGVGMVHQHFMLVDPLTVAENLVLGQEPRRWGLLDLDAARRAVREVSEAHGLMVDPDDRVGDLSVGERQRVEILKVLHRGARVLVLDEPTAVLTPQEIDRLLDMIRRFRASGRTVILVTHKLDEVMAVANRVTIIRAGQKVADLDASTTSARGLAHLVVGREVPQAARVAHAPPEGPPALRVDDLVVDRRGACRVDRVSFQVGPGEIVGVAGVMGNGQTELLEALAGLIPARGRIELDGADISWLSPKERFEAGLSHIPEDRGDRGLVGSFTIAENLALGGDLGPPWSLARSRIRAEALDRMGAFDVRPPDPDLPVQALSGGNAQKVVVARELSRRPKVLLAGQPTRGVDVGAVEVIHARLRQCRADGTGVLLVSADLQEILALSDRVLVLLHGRVKGEFLAEDADPRVLGEHMTGAGGDA